MGLARSRKNEAAIEGAADFRWCSVSWSLVVQPPKTKALQAGAIRVPEGGEHRTEGQGPAREQHRAQEQERSGDERRRWVSKIEPLPWLRNDTLKRWA